jgi:hypothetical protein
LDFPWEGGQEKFKDKGMMMRGWWVGIDMSEGSGEWVSPDNEV